VRFGGLNLLFLDSRSGSFGQSSLPSINLIGNHIKSVGIINCCGHLVFLLIGNLSNCTSKNLTTAGFWQFLNEDNANQSCKGTNFSSNSFIDGLSDGIQFLLSLVFLARTSEDAVGKWTLTTKRLIVADYSTLNNHIMSVDNFLKASCGNSMT